MKNFKAIISRFALPTLLMCVINAGVWPFIFTGCFRHATKLGNYQPGLTLRDSTSSGRSLAQDTSGTGVQKLPAPKGSSGRNPSDIRTTQDTTKGFAVDSVNRKKDTVLAIRTNAFHDSLSAGHALDTLLLKSKNDMVLTSADSSKIKSDTLSLDSLKLSKWLSDLRRDYPQAQTLPEYRFPLFLYSTVIQRTTTIDSVGDYVDIRETLWGKDIKVPIQIPLNEYVKLEQKHFTQQTWEDLAHTYVSKSAENQLGSLMSGITNIDIPIPANPVLSIFGPPRIDLKISGAVDVHGAWRNQKTNQQTLSALGNVTNQPDFKQDVQINVDGTVGDKLGIGANWDTQNQFDYENQLHIKYTGYDDEIIKTVEAGNVSMSTNSSFIGSSQALFGIKATAQFGPLTLTGLASQQKAQGKAITYNGGSSAQTFNLHAYDFSTNHFFIDTNYIREYEDYYQTNRINIDEPTLIITDYEVYESVFNPAGNPNVRSCVAVMDLKPNNNSNSNYYSNLKNKSIDNPIPQNPGKVEYGNFIKLDNSQFTIDKNTGVLTLNSSYSDEQVIAVVYRTQGDTTYGTFSYADTSSNDRLVLKLVKPANLKNPGGNYAEAWRLMLRNIYPLGGSNFNQNSIKDLKILYTPSGTTAQDNINGISLVHLFHLDGTGTAGAQNTFYYNENVDIDPARGEIILPFTKPFVEAFHQSGSLAIPNPDSISYSSIYDTTSDVYASDIHNLFSITGSYVGSSSSKINLGFNLVQGSVKVLLNGQPLVPDQDYSIDYLTGELSIRNQAALVTGANVQIQYETNDLFQIASKSLSGLRGDLKINDQTGLGFTLMNYTLQSPNDKVQVGEEPMSNMILGVDGGTSVDLPFLTKALDALPLIRTAAPSKLTLHGEGAYMLPTPNTRTSPIPDDNGQGVAYIDDFEGAKRTIPLPINYSSWSIASPPKNTAVDSVLNRQIPDSTKNDYRGWAYWYNVQPPTTPSKAIWPTKQVALDQQTVTVLDIGFLGGVRGQYNRSRNIGSTLDTNYSNPILAKLAWGGMMLDLSSNASDLVSQNINYLEIWMQIDTSIRNPKGTMHIDIGQMSEDVFGDGVFRSEDTTGLGVRDNDFGIDQLSDAGEDSLFPWIKNNPDRSWDPKGTDPDGDDFNGDIASAGYFRVNGTEGNAVAATGLLPDGEDLNHNRFLDQTNSYYEYNVRLDTVNNKYINGGGNKGWYQYIIPLKDTSKVIGSPSLSVVQSVRIWLDGMTSPILVHIAEMDLVGNYWRVPNVKDTTMQSSVVNVFDNPGYQAPVDGLQPVDHSNPTQNLLLNEQSLDLILNGLHGGDSRYVFKYFPTSLNVFHYKNMKFFVHGDPNFYYDQHDSTNHDADIYLRFGSDSMNFYEYRQPVRYANQPPSRPGWEDATINFAELTAIKQRRDSVNQPHVLPQSAGNGVPGSTYWLQGNPSLMNVSYFQIGIANARPGSATILRGSVYVDELRLTNADNTPGGAYRFDASLQLADLGSLSFNFSKTDPYFHGLTTQFGSLNTEQNWAVSASVSLERLLPREWQGTTIPFSYSHVESFSNPLYLAGSDILVTEAVSKRALHLVDEGMSSAEAASQADSLRVSSQVLRVQDSWSIPTLRIAVPSTKWYVKDIVNNISLGYSWSGSKYRDTQVKTGDQWTWNFQSGYSVQFDPAAWYTPFPSKNKPTPSTAPVSNPTVPGFNPTLGNPEGTNPPAITPSSASLGQDFRIRYLPNSLSLSMSASRMLDVEDYWTQTTTRINPTFSAQRSGGFNWQITNNGILNPTIDYRFNISSSLYTIDVDTVGLSTGRPPRPRPNSYVFSQIFLNNGLINFGTDYDYSQQFSLTTQPKLPFNLQQYFDMQASYNSAYHWSNSLQQAQYGRGSGTNGTLQLGSTIRLKLLTDPWFGSTSTASAATSTTPAPAQQQQPPTATPRGRGQGREEFETTTDTTSATGTSTKGNQIGNVANLLIKTPFLNFESISINFSSANTSQNGGLPSLRPGMGNFFRVPFIQESNSSMGPSQLYQLGLVSDPYGKLVFFKKNGFPFFGFDQTPTTRIAGPGVQISDNFSNTNSLDIKTSRNLWQGARIDLSWHVGWSYNRNISFQTDAHGNPIDSASLTNVALAGQINKSFFTIPPVFIFKLFKSGISQVASDYQSLKNSDTLSTDDQKISQAFIKGFESLPILDKIFGQYMPRMNYSFTWDGLEQLPLFKSFATHVSFNHAYQSSYSESWHSTNGAAQVTDAQAISYGFQPLAGLNIAFKSIGDATISGSVLYNTSTQYSLNPSARSIAQQQTGQLTITADYAKKGFSIPLFGLNLQNDIDISASYSSAASTQSSFSIDSFTPDGTPIGGTTQNTLEVRFKYDISQRVTASIYYRNTKIIPTTQSLVPGTTTNEAGIDVHVSIAG